MRIFIASKDERLKLAIQLYLGQEPGIVMAGMSDRLHGLLIQLEGCQPDVLLLDWELCQQPMMDLLSELHNLDSRPKIIVLSRDFTNKRNRPGGWRRWFHQQGLSAGQAAAHP